MEKTCLEKPLLEKICFRKTDFGKKRFWKNRFGKMTVWENISWVPTRSICGSRCHVSGNSPKQSDANTVKVRDVLWVEPTKHPKHAAWNSSVHCCSVCHCHDHARLELQGRQNTTNSQGESSASSHCAQHGASMSTSKRCLSSSSFVGAMECMDGVRTFALYMEVRQLLARWVQQVATMFRFLQIWSPLQSSRLAP